MLSLGITKDRLPKKGETVVFPSPIQLNVCFVVRLTSEPAIYSGKLYEVLHDTL